MCIFFKMQLARENKRLDEEERARGQVTKGFRYLV